MELNKRKDNKIEELNTKLDKKIGSINQIEIGFVISPNIPGNSYYDCEVSFDGKFTVPPQNVTFSVCSIDRNPNNITVWSLVSAKRLPNFNKDGGTIRVFNNSTVTISGVRIDWIAFA